MSFTLRITFGGLCLFAPDDTDPVTEKMHVLTATTSATHHHGGKTDDAGKAEPHYTLLIYDKAYSKKAQPLTGVPDFFNLEGSTLRIASPSTDTINIRSLPEEVVNMSEIAKKYIDASLVVGVNLPEQLAFRLTLDSGHCTPLHEGALWFFYGKGRNITPLVEWTSKFDDKELHWTFNGAGLPPATLYPIKDKEGNDVVEVVIFNVPVTEVPKRLPLIPIQGDEQPGFEAKHFDAYYDIMSPVDGKRECPRLMADVNPNAMMAVNPFRCLTAQAKVETRADL